MPTSFLKGLKDSQVCPNQDSGPKAPVLYSCEQAKSLSAKAVLVDHNGNPGLGRRSLSLRERAAFIKSGRSCKPQSLEMDFLEAHYPYTNKLQPNK